MTMTFLSLAISTLVKYIELIIFQVHKTKKSNSLVFETFNISWLTH